MPRLLDGLSGFGCIDDKYHPAYRRDKIQTPFACRHIRRKLTPILANIPENAVPFYSGRG